MQHFFNQNLPNKAKTISSRGTPRHTLLYAASWQPDLKALFSKLILCQRYIGDQPHVTSK